jgi:hypothetical protein
MMQIPDLFLEQRVRVRRRLGYDANGALYDPEGGDIPALVVDESSLVSDERSESPTRGSQILATGYVLVQADQYIPPGSLVRTWIGTPMERTGEVVKTAYLEHSQVSAYARAWVV